jgi:hypothetical protein
MTLVESTKPLLALRRSLALVGVLAAVACGCSEKGEPRLVDYLAQLEFDVPLESATYVSLGKFDIPAVAHHVPHPEGLANVPAHPHIWMRVQFELTAETTPRWKDAIEKAAKQHRGALSDAVLTVVRTSPVSELADPRLSSINARLTDIVRPMLGEDRVRRLMFNKLEQPVVDPPSGKKGRGKKGNSSDGQGSHRQGHGASEKDEHGGHH